MRVYVLNKEGRLDSVQNKMMTDSEHKQWVIISPKELEHHKAPFHVKEKTIKECTEHCDIPKIEMYEQYDFGRIHGIEEANGEFAKHQIAFYLSKHYLILVTEDHHPSLKYLEQEVKNNTDESYTIEKILYLLIEDFVDQDEARLTHIEDEISELEEGILKGGKQEYIKDIITLRKKLLYFKKHYDPLMDMLMILLEDENELLDEKAKRYFRMLNNHVNRINMQIVNLRDYVSQVREAYDAQVDIGLNKIMKVFTVITVIFSPLTVIVGWYGMNFSYMPELAWKWGYFYVVGVSILSIMISIYYFKKKGWL